MSLATADLLAHHEIATRKGRSTILLASTPPFLPLSIALLNANALKVADPTVAESAKVPPFTVAVLVGHMMNFNPGPLKI